MNTIENQDTRLILVVKPKKHALSRKESQVEIRERAERIKQAIDYLNQKIASIEREGEPSPPGCSVARYTAKGRKNRYWYYQLKADKAIFPKVKKENEFSHYQHLGKAGSEAHVDAILSVVRRIQIEELTKAIDGLKESWCDLYSDDKKVGNRVD